jgi:hypothetical protein
MSEAIPVTALAQAGFWRDKREVEVERFDDIHVTRGE